MEGAVDANGRVLIGWLVQALMKDESEIMKERLQELFQTARLS